MAKKETDEKPEKITFDIDKNKNFSEWFSEIVKMAELADLRYKVKGFLVFQPWSVLAMEKMYKIYEDALQKKGHNPYFFPALTINPFFVFSISVANSLIIFILS